ncbi:hypothetical protein NP493_5951g00000 [Ridgeia piscesae]|nr:hypothetical protein NP493_5951g00003 [Ridgeia piscesae]KAK2140159.1 hypothetical protein NP493_5951g00000 [Ridgeia piscesae]
MLTSGWMTWTDALTMQSISRGAEVLSRGVQQSSSSQAGGRAPDSPTRFASFAYQVVRRRRGKCRFSPQRKKLLSLQKKSPFPK